MLDQGDIYDEKNGRLSWQDWQFLLLQGPSLMYSLRIFLTTCVFIDVSFVVCFISGGSLFQVLITAMCGMFSSLLFKCF